MMQNLRKDKLLDGTNKLMGRIYYIVGLIVVAGARAMLFAVTS